ncbi:MAG: hypothetical protein JWQ14_1159, partial [Adhaeribacter sp.]|nr:hypothetical protein [Adhaeribacter sp.]
GQGSDFRFGQGGIVQDIYMNLKANR